MENRGKKVKTNIKGKKTCQTNDKKKQEKPKIG